MTPADAQRLLAVAATYDNRKPNEDAAKAWAFALGDANVNDCIRAIAEHYAESTEYLLPAHIKRGVKRIRSGRIASAGHPLPPRELADDPQRELAWRRTAAEALGSGATTEQAAAHADSQHGTTSNYLPEVPVVAALTQLRESMRMPKSDDDTNPTTEGAP